MDNTLKVALIAGGTLIVSLFAFRKTIKKQISNMLTDIVTETLKQEKLHNHASNALVEVARKEDVYNNLSELLQKTLNDTKTLKLTTEYINKSLEMDSTQGKVLALVKSTTTKSLNDKVIVQTITDKSKGLALDLINDKDVNKQLLEFLNVLLKNEELRKNLVNYISLLVSDHETREALIELLKG